MIARLLSRWQQVKQHLVTDLVVAIILIVAIALIIVEIKMYGTGFTGKALWDWLQLLIIPLGLAAVAFLFQRATTRTEQKIAAVRYEQDRIIALDRQREDLLQIYLDRMSELLSEKGLRTSERGSEVRMVARARTITILFQLDARRMGYVFAFLRDAGLMKPDNSIVSFYRADLKKINLSSADLTGANLYGANLIDATLSYANLGNADLSRAELRNSDFGGANLFEASFRSANLTNAFFANTNCGFARFNDAILSGADFRGANLSETDFTNADLSGADFEDADFTKAFLAQANLTRAKVTEEQLENVRSLKGTIMPDGSIHQ